MCSAAPARSALAADMIASLITLFSFENLVPN